MVQAHLWISGIVQGVGYRYTCRRQGQGLGLTGWVRNLPDGRVEAVVQGPQKQVDELIRWCYRGPEEARVSDIQVTFETVSVSFPDFGIR